MAVRLGRLTMSRDYGPGDTWIRVFDAYRGLGWFIFALAAMVWVAVNVAYWDDRLVVIDAAGTMLAALWAVYFFLRFYIAARG